MTLIAQPVLDKNDSTHNEKPHSEYDNSQLHSWLCIEKFAFVYAALGHWKGHRVRPGVRERKRFYSDILIGGSCGWYCSKIEEIPSLSRITIFFSCLFFRFSHTFYECTIWINLLWFNRAIIYSNKWKANARSIQYMSTRLLFVCWLNSIAILSENIEKKFQFSSLRPNHEEYQYLLYSVVVFFFGFAANLFHSVLWWPSESVFMSLITNVTGQWPLGSHWRIVLCMCVCKFPSINWPLLSADFFLTPDIDALAGNPYYMSRIYAI